MRLQSPMIILFVFSLSLASPPSAHAWSPIDGVERAMRAFEQERFFERCGWIAVSKTGEGKKKEEAAAEEEPDCE